MDDLRLVIPDVVPEKSKSEGTFVQEYEVEVEDFGFEESNDRQVVLYFQCSNPTPETALLPAEDGIQAALNYRSRTTFNVKGIRIVIYCDEPVKAKMQNKILFVSNQNGSGDATP